MVLVPLPAPQGGGSGCGGCGGRPGVTGPTGSGFCVVEPVCRVLGSDEDPGPPGKKL